ncbi:glycosyltransferase family 2 protein [Ammoniphilus sp. CFH 90114]|uniref:glycosyltransferase family 2 protein n=1 Tax=Ammoniphilus sp. CFH 90114 TaxID=2493665 RepID=UPI00100E3EA8|nr:glycosyltransferase [Ammoniphilus sp. CFH 90114]RXT13988.1 glycosyltransferase [Ammoniphilus sp. CFH 90114]
MSIDVSIVIPSYNRYPLNKLTLYALSKQDYDLSKFEVLLIDDASTDRTPKLKETTLPYPFQYIRNPRNLGLAPSRNVGIQHARGEIIVFLDAEVIVDPNFVRLHFNNHQTHERAVVTGGSINLIYSFLFPDFQDWQWKSLQNFMKTSEHFSKRVKNMVGRDVTHKELPRVIKELSSPLKLLRRADVKNFQSIQRLSKPRSYEKKLFEQLGYSSDGCRLSWLFCIGLNHSVRRSFIDIAGLYDDQFQGWGLEDYEFGYRLSNAGAHYIADPRIHLYHQEHPIKLSIKEEQARNMIFFQQKHPVMDVCIISLQYIGITDFRYMEKVLQEYHALSVDYPNQFNIFKGSILHMLQAIPIKICEDNWRVTNLLSSFVSQNGEIQEKRMIFKERNVVHLYGKYDCLVEVFDKLVSFEEGESTINEFKESLGRESSKKS